MMDAIGKITGARFILSLPIENQLVTGEAINVHATAVVLGTRGFLFVGPSGAGKTTLALSCMTAAHNDGLFAALVVDDQVLDLARTTAGSSRAARRRSRAWPRSAAPALSSSKRSRAAVLDCAILPVKPPFEPRMPPENETVSLPFGDFLPLLRLPLAEGLNSLAILRLILPQNADFQGR